MASYKEIQDYVRSRNGFVPKTCWIAHVKAQNGIPTRTAPNRQGVGRVEPSPPERRQAIEQAFRDLGMLK